MVDRGHVFSRSQVGSLAIGLGGAIALLALLGIAYSVEHSPRLERFDLDGELTVPSAFSALLLLAAAVALTRGSRRGLGAPAVLLAVLVVGGALDESVEIHERLGNFLGLDWQLLYLPVFAIAGVLWLLVLRRLPHGGFARRLYIAGAACWVLAEVLEAAEWRDDVARSGYTTMTVVEEIAEMTGSGLFLLAVLVGSSLLEQSRSAQHAGTASPADRVR